jgi:hypothetical protein
MAIDFAPEPPEIIWREGVEYRRVRKQAGPAPAVDTTVEAHRRLLTKLFDRQLGRCYHCNDRITERGTGVRVPGPGPDGVLICASCAHPRARG